MNKTISIGLLALALVACGDDSGGDDGNTAADSGTGATSSPGTTDPMGSTSTDPTTTDPGTTSTDPGTTSSATSGSTGDDSTGADGSTGEVDFALTSPSFAEGETIPGIHHINGGNISPQLDWVGVPAEALSLGVFFQDLTFNDFPHSGIWNIPVDATGLPEDVEHVAMPPSVPGALQCRNWQNNFGYGGMGSESNTYQFTLFALDVENLDAEIDENSSLDEVRQAMVDHAIATATLSGQSGGANAPG